MVNNILNELYSYTKFGIKLGLDNIKQILKKCENPQDSYKIIHIAGTNGKGSTASIIEHSLIEAGFSVGKYTSPHIINFNERIVVDKNEITDEDITKYYLKIKKIILENDIKATFFEVTTAMAFLYFKDMNIDYLVAEVGLGGKYDATNVVNPILSIITNISYDHINILGNTLEEIAEEKCGIIKNSPVVILDKQKVLLDCVKSRTNNYIIANKKFNYTTTLDKEKFFTNISINKKKFNLSLYGIFQGDNFILAYSALKYLNIDDIFIQNAVKNIYWPGRFEVFSKTPLIILDGAHNEDSALALKNNCLEILKKDDIVLITSILEDKDSDTVLKTFSEFTNIVIFTSLKYYYRGLSAKDLYNKGKKHFKFSNYKEDIQEAFNLAKKFNKKAIVIAGSFYLISEFKKNI
ncbi:dihydrofolate synthase/folylpolyglutamate synthase [Hypnocyclicus thermotrophus]|uniref:tetrahydrofolate synthase n=1 Tax=Hypnocyclicus thermotrophus TaxID=1627895 RepID=A0AA46DYY6_9FUSO|nr:folylpolyglutamate synthase/dihydrofolate synthase family protein [Hypnocyclicus thermotrophus]TDT71408.1 dihydrofolate synthase/folylpolyglutamate synthase [Hypnocyclicus thermotrophus]